jgi:hypothetical protein
MTFNCVRYVILVAGYWLPGCMMLDAEPWNPEP